jgi:hypothetical protein
MRHGLIQWRDENLSQAEVQTRQDHICAALRAAGLDALLLYTNHIRSGAVTWACGFTPYWSDALWLLPIDARPLFVTALSKRLGNWIAATNPTSEIAHSPRPGELIGARLAALKARRVGVVELDRLPAGLMAEITNVTDAELIDATTVFAALRMQPDASETRLTARTDAIARQAFAAMPAHRVRVGDVTEALELSARLAGAEEIYVATAPDLASDARLARIKGGVPLGERFAVRLSVAFAGTWIRRTETFTRADTPAPDIYCARAWFADVCATAVAGPGLQEHLVSKPPPEGLRLDDWLLEAPCATRPLQIVAEHGMDPVMAHANATISVRLTGPCGPVILARPLIGPEGAG